MQPRISVIIPAYNAEAFIANAINSIVDQSSYADSTEIIVVDDGSTDNTTQIVADLSRRYSTLKLFTNDRQKGPSGARNVGLDNAGGDFIAFLDADDLWYPDHLEKAIAFLQRHQAVDVVFYNFDIHELDTQRVIGDWFSERNYPRALASDQIEDKYYLIKQDMLNALFEESFLHLQSMVIKRKAVEGVRFNESVLRSGDRDFAVTLADKSNAKYAFGEMVTGVWFRHEKSLTTNSTDAFVAMALDHISFYMDYLSRYTNRPGSAPILKNILRVNYLDVSYHYRHTNELSVSLGYLIKSLKYGVRTDQIVQFVKICAAFFIYKLFQCRKPDNAKDTG